MKEIKRLSMREMIETKRKKDLEFVVMYLLMITVLLMAYLLINNDWVRGVMFSMIIIYACKKACEWLVDTDKQRS